MSEYKSPYCPRVQGDAKSIVDNIISIVKEEIAREKAMDDVNRIHVRHRGIVRRSETSARLRNAVGWVVILLALVLWAITVFFSSAPVPAPISSALIEKPLLRQAVVPATISRALDYMDLGEYTITAYCPCKKCCGEWAENRLNGIVYGAYGDVLEAGVSVAAPLPAGAVLFIEGLGKYIVQDSTADWIIDRYNGRIVDVYYTNHEEAVKFGKQTAKVFLIR